MESKGNLLVWNEPGVKIGPNFNVWKVEWLIHWKQSRKIVLFLAVLQVLSMAMGS